MPIKKKRIMDGGMFALRSFLVLLNDNAKDGLKQLNTSGKEILFAPFLFTTACCGDRP